MLIVYDECGNDTGDPSCDGKDGNKKYRPTTLIVYSNGRKNDA
jgi:hypothetical protein